MTVSAAYTILLSAVMKMAIVSHLMRSIPIVLLTNRGESEMAIALVVHIIHLIAVTRGVTVNPFTPDIHTVTLITLLVLAMETVMEEITIVQSAILITMIA